MGDRTLSEGKAAELGDRTLNDARMPAALLAGSVDEPFTARTKTAHHAFGTIAKAVELRGIASIEWP